MTNKLSYKYALMEYLDIPKEYHKVTITDRMVLKLICTCAKFFSLDLSNCIKLRDLKEEIYWAITHEYNSDWLDPKDKLRLRKEVIKILEGK